jgi:hypothetical protein
MFLSLLTIYIIIYFVLFSGCGESSKWIAAATNEEFRTQHCTPHPPVNVKGVNCLKRVQSMLGESSETGSRSLRSHKNSKVEASAPPALDPELLHSIASTIENAVETASSTLVDMHDAQSQLGNITAEKDVLSEQLAVSKSKLAVQQRDDTRTKNRLSAAAFNPENSEPFDSLLRMQKTRAIQGVRDALLLASLSADGSATAGLVCVRWMLTMPRTLISSHMQIKYRASTGAVSSALCSMLSLAGYCVGSGIKKLVPYLLVPM